MHQAYFTQSVDLLKSLNLNLSVLSYSCSLPLVDATLFAGAGPVGTAEWRRILPQS